MDIATQIDLLIDRTPGAMARAVASLRRFDLRFARHQLREVTEHDLSRLLIVAEGGAVAPELSACLYAVHEVLKVVEVISNDAAVAA